MTPQTTRRAARLLSTGGALALMLASRAALAQGNSPLAKPLPNVLLLVDTSGSMERMPTGEMPTCTPGVESVPNRWGMLVQAMTGTIQPFFSCGVLQRDPSTSGPGVPASGFHNIFWNNTIWGAGFADAVGKYDYGYTIPHFRPLSGEGADICVIYPNQEQTPLTGYGSTFDPDRISTYPFRTSGSLTPTTARNTCSFSQNEDGQLDLGSAFARFGLMTFDSDPREGTGTTGQNPPLSLGGMWTFLPNSNMASAASQGYVSPAPAGDLLGCLVPTKMAVGARNEYAPPWEGPFIKFPPAAATQDVLATHNSNVQLAIQAARPYGATPIAGMMKNAYDYFLKRSDGPSTSGVDDYARGGCREQFVILMTDGAPNMDLRPTSPTDLNCGFAGNGDEQPQCPFWRPEHTARRLRTDSGTMSPIETFVIGFSVNRDINSTTDGFPAGLTERTCTGWINSLGSVAAMNTACFSALPPPGSTAAACCTLNTIAAAGDPAGLRGAYFAETQADLAAAFSEILGRIAQGSATRAIPAYSGASTTGTGTGTTTQSATYIASFKADPAERTGMTSLSANIWTGNIQRTRAICTSGSTTDLPVDESSGDDFETNLKRRTTGENGRFFFTAIPAALPGTDGKDHQDGTESLRPYLPASEADGVPRVIANERIVSSSDLPNLPSVLGVNKEDFLDLFEISGSTCKASKRKDGFELPSIKEKDDCAKVMWGFATAATVGEYGTLKTEKKGDRDGGIYALRCPNPPTECKPLGAIGRSSPTVAGPPSSLLRDEGYRAFAERFRSRKQALYVATHDGLLHAFDADYNPVGTPAAHNSGEFWAFLPPAVLSQLKSNFPAGQTPLLDGSPVVKDVVFSRDRTAIGAREAWHTALVAGLGRNPDGIGGYYALDVTADGEIRDKSLWSPPTPYNTAGLTAVLQPTTGISKPGPHFLWQLTTVVAAGSNNQGKRKGHKGSGKDKNKRGQELYNLFGEETSTPAITTLFFDPDGAGAREIGVAILPGGWDGPGTYPASCPRKLTTLPNFPTGFAPRANVRCWAPGANDPVGGRSVTVVRLDNGKIIRHFARAGSLDKDVPRRLVDMGICPFNSSVTNCIVIDTPLDAPMTGVPAVFPSDVGSIAQKAFIGDADGTLWRFDFSSTNPNNWKGELFLDTLAPNAVPASATLVGAKPIAVPPVLSLSETGNLVISVANGSQEDLGASTPTDHNFVWSVTELPPQGTSGARAKLNWYLPLAAGERVTGPMAVFDKTLYFATFKVNTSGTVCSNGRSYLHGQDYVLPFDPSDPRQGGKIRLAREDQGEDLVPGVSIRASQACSTSQNTTDYFGGLRIGALLTTPTQFSLFANKSRSTGGVNGISVAQIEKRLALPRTQTIVDAWAAVVE